MKSLLFFADVTENESLIVERAATRLRELLEAADKSPWSSDVQPVPRSEGKGAPPPEAVYVLSLAKWLEQPLEPWGQVATAVRGRVRALASRGPKVVLLTIFRHVPMGSDPHADRDLLVRIRRLNLLAIELSNEFNVSVADLDRDFADIGALPLATDFRLGGEAAAALAAWALVRCVTANAVDGLVDFGLQDKVLAANLTERPKIEGAAFAPVTKATRFGRGRRAQMVHSVPGGIDRGNAPLVAGALKGEVPIGEIWIRLDKAIRGRRPLDTIRLLTRELVKMTVGRRA